MRFVTLVSPLAMCGLATSCGIVLHPSVHALSAHGGAGSPILAKRQTTQLPMDNETHWTVAQNTRQMQVSDDAFIARDLARFNHHPNSTIYYTGGVVMNLTEHLQDMRLTFSIYSDMAPHNHDYKLIFGEGDWTVAVSDARGTNDGPLPSLAGPLLPPTRRAAKFDLMTISRWNGGLMMEEYLWSDAVAVYRQLGQLPSPPPADLPDLALNPSTAPLAATPGVDASAANKDKARAADAAFNAGALDADSLHLAPNVTVFGLGDERLDAQGYLDALRAWRTAFPDLRVEERQLIAQGDWTASIVNLSGTHLGPLALPAYLAEQPVAPTNKSFELLHYTICRWQGGEIVGMRVNLDMFGILGALGVEV